MPTLTETAFQIDAFQNDAFQTVAADVVAVDSASLILSGSAIAEVERILVTSTNLLFTGQSITIAEISVEIIPIASAPLIFAPQIITIRDNELVGSINLSFIGSSITILDSERIAISSAALSFLGRTITTTDTDIILIVNASLVFSGQTINVGDSVKYRALSDITLPGEIYVESGTRFRGPPGWIPSISVEPLDDSAIQAYWEAGPAGMSNADSVWGLGTWASWNKRSGVFVGVPEVRWVPVQGQEDVFILTGNGASLGPKR